MAVILGVWLVGAAALNFLWLRRGWPGTTSEAAQAWFETTGSIAALVGAGILLCVFLNWIL